MATAKNIKVKNYCDSLYQELSGMKERINAIVGNLGKTYGTESELFRTQEKHLFELADFVEWKLQILLKACPYDWKGLGEEAESTVSVHEPEKEPGPDFSGGYVGG